jgi:branched-subunit amino acid transport protein
MSAGEIWLTIAGLTVITVLTRSFFLMLGDAVRLPRRVQHALRYAPACALVALVAPEALMQQGALAVSLANPKLIGALAAIVAILATRNTLLTMAIGMAAFLAARAWL